MQEGAQKRSLIDKALSYEVDLTEETLENSPVFDLLEQGGPNAYTQFQMELSKTQDEGVTVTMKVQCTNTPDVSDSWTDTGIVLSNIPRSDGEDMSWTNTNMHVRRYIRVVPTVTIDEDATEGTAASGTATFFIAM
ncbi:MAG: hypothetical protein Q4C88_06770 [Akkermansia sp.]|nr:hypothetical protein [Akkermansia sp.]